MDNLGSSERRILARAANLGLKKFFGCHGHHHQAVSEVGIYALTHHALCVTLNEITLLAVLREKLSGFFCHILCYTNALHSGWLLLVLRTKTSEDDNKYGSWVQSGQIAPRLGSIARVVPHLVELVWLSKTQLRVLSLLNEEEAVEATEVAIRFGLSPSWASTTLKRLWEKGYVKRRVSSSVTGGVFYLYIKEVRY